MDVEIIKNINEKENNRVEYKFQNIDSREDFDRIKSILLKDFGLVVYQNNETETSASNRLINCMSEYYLVWDVNEGNYIYSAKQDDLAFEKLEGELEKVKNKLNSMN